MKDYSEDFVGWCRDCVKVSDKMTGLPVALELNAPQRRVASIMERERRLGRPIRIIMLKARQWGGSTLVQAYMAWMQLVRRKSWSSLVCAHNKDAAAVIRGAYSKIIGNYPEDLRSEGDWKLQSFERTQGVLYLPARDCRIAIATANRPDALRGSAFHMAHLSEAAFWGDGDEAVASAIIRTVSSMVPMVSDSLVVIESTANGRNNYLYNEWKRAERGESDKRCVFVPWFEIENYSFVLSEEEKEMVVGSLSEYEKELMRLGATEGNIAWYRSKGKEYQSRDEMMAEFPSTPEEAFVSSEHRAFGEGERPERGEGVGKEVLVVAVPDAEGCRHVMSLFGVGGGKLYNLRDEEFGSMQMMMERCVELSRGGLMIAIADMGDERGISYSRWCERYCRERGGVMACDGDERSVMEMSVGTMGYLVELHRHLLMEGRIVECSGEGEREYGQFSVDGGRSYRLMLSRLVAGHYLWSRIREEKLRIEDFL